MKSYRIGSGDPGRFNDGFAFVLTRLEKLERDWKIYVLGAKGWKGEQYPVVESELAQIHTKKSLDFFVVEQNNTGINVIESLRLRYGIPVRSVVSSNRIKSAQVIRKGQTMDKFEMRAWIEEQRQFGRILFPKQKTDGIKQLESQLASFVRKVTKSGTVTYSAEGSQHDDFVMALMVNLFFIRRKLLKDLNHNRRRIVTKKYEVDDSNSIFGTGIPSGSIMLGRSTYHPSGEFVRGRVRVH